VCVCLFACACEDLFLFWGHSGLWGHFKGLGYSHSLITIDCSGTHKRSSSRSSISRAPWLEHRVCVCLFACACEDLFLLWGHFVLWEHFKGLGNSHYLMGIDCSGIYKRSSSRSSTFRAPYPEGADQPDGEEWKGGHRPAGGRVTAYCIHTLTNLRHSFTLSF